MLIIFLYRIVIIVFLIVNNSLFNLYLIEIIFLIVSFFEILLVYRFL